MAPKGEMGPPLTDLRSKMLDKFKQTLAAGDAAADSTASAIAKDIEAELHGLHSNPKEYSNKGRSLLFNLQKNKILKKGVLNGGWEPARLVRAPTNELATTHLRQQREASAERYVQRRQLGQSDERVVGWNAGTDGKLAGSFKFEGADAAARAKAAEGGAPSDDAHVQARVVMVGDECVEQFVDMRADAASAEMGLDAALDAAEGAEAKVNLGAAGAETAAEAAAPMETDGADPYAAALGHSDDQFSEPEDPAIPPTDPPRQMHPPPVALPPPAKRRKTSPPEGAKSGAKIGDGAKSGDGLRLACLPDRVRLVGLSDAAADLGGNLGGAGDAARAEAALRRVRAIAGAVVAGMQQM